MTAVNAEAASNVSGLRPAIDSANSNTAISATSRTKNPTVPAVAGSMRRKSSGPIARPSARAMAQPRISRRMTAATRMWIE
jgi:hypothetical protein